MAILVTRDAYKEISKLLPLPTDQVELTIRLVVGKNVTINGEEVEMPSKELWKLLPFDLPQCAVGLEIHLGINTVATYTVTGTLS